MSFKEMGQSPKWAAPSEKAEPGFKPFPVAGQLVEVGGAAFVGAKAVSPPGVADKTEFTPTVLTASHGCPLDFVVRGEETGQIAIPHEERGTVLGWLLVFPDDEVGDASPGRGGAVEVPPLVLIALVAELGAYHFGRSAALVDAEVSFGSRRRLCGVVPTLVGVSRFLERYAATAYASGEGRLADEARL